MANKYVDVKIKIWQRLNFTDDADMSKITRLLYEGCTTDQIAEEGFGFIDCEILYDTESQMTVEENEGNTTVQIYENEKEIWNNKNMQ